MLKYWEYRTRMRKDEDRPYKHTQQRAYLLQEISGFPGFPIVIKLENFLLHCFLSSEKCNETSPWQLPNPVCSTSFPKGVFHRRRFTLV